MFAINSNSDVLRQLLCLHHYDKGTRSNMWLFKTLCHMGTDNLLQVIIICYLPQVNQNVFPY